MNSVLNYMIDAEASTRRSTFWIFCQARWKNTLVLCLKINSPNTKEITASILKLAVLVRAPLLCEESLTRYPADYIFPVE